MSRVQIKTPAEVTKLAEQSLPEIVQVLYASDCGMPVGSFPTRWTYGGSFYYGRIIEKREDGEIIAVHYTNHTYTKRIVILND